MHGVLYCITLQFTSALLLLSTTDSLNSSPHTSIMSEDATAQQNSSQQTQCSTKEGGSFADAASGGRATSSAAAASGGCVANQAGSTKQVGSTTSPLAAALVLNDKFIKLLHIMSQPFLFLQRLITSVLRKFANAYNADKKHKETKSDQKYVSKSVKALGFPLQGVWCKPGWLKKLVNITFYEFFMSDLLNI